MALRLPVFVLRRRALPLAVALGVGACAGPDSERTAANPSAEIGDPVTVPPAGVPPVEIPDTTTPAVETPPPPPASAPAPDQWTAEIVEKVQPVSGVALLSDVRAGRNEGFDRLVLEFEDDIIPSYHIEYVDRPVRQCGSGDEVPVAGDGWLSVRLEPANAHTEEGVATIEERSSMPGLPVILQLTMICDFEAQVEWVLGVRAPNRFRVMELAEPARLIVDVRHE